VIAALLSLAALAAAQTGEHENSHRGIYHAAAEMSVFVPCGTDERWWATSYSQGANEWFVSNESYPIYMEIAGKLVDRKRPKVKTSGRYYKEVFVYRVLETAEAGQPAYEACRRGELPEGEAE
jgi:hypothetical protein